MCGAQPVDGLVIIALRVRDPERREQVVHRLENICRERPLPHLFEVNIGDWDEGAWDAEVEWLSEVVAGTRDSVVVWRFSGNSYTRFAIGDGGY